MNFLFLDPTEEEKAQVFRYVCSHRLLDESTPHNMVIDQLKERYVECFGELQRPIISTDTETLHGWVGAIADDAMDRLTPEAIVAVTHRHVLLVPQTEILIAHVARIVSRQLELSTTHEDIIAGVQRLYGVAAKRVRTRVTQDA